MTLYETIFKRRSVRKYDAAPLDEATLAEIRAFLDGAERMEGQDARFTFATADEVNGGAAPHYILAHCKPGDAAYANIGYTLQKVDLFLQSKGLGSLWMGMAKPQKPEADYAILLAFGKTDVPARGSESEFKRIPLAEVSDQDNEVSRAVRLAPSAVNSQPWKVRMEDGKVVLRYFGRGLMKLLLKKKENKVDLGIAARHAALALEHTGKKITAVTPQEGKGGLEIGISFE